MPSIDQPVVLKGKLGILLNPQTMLVTHEEKNPHGFMKKNAPEMQGVSNRATRVLIEKRKSKAGKSSGPLNRKIISAGEFELKPGSPRPNEFVFLSEKGTDYIGVMTGPDRFLLTHRNLHGKAPVQGMRSMGPHETITVFHAMQEPREIGRIQPQKLVFLKARGVNAEENHE
ncbi:MAG: hypothetical protein HY917_02240 [Candidatus Diapherotrites archaeon]|nr:hypothetical protein [Candidatus Diapherotrites archaeon]